MFVRVYRAALVPAQFYCDTAATADCPSIVVPTAAGLTTQYTSDYVHNYFGFDYVDRWYFTLSTALFAVVYRGLAMLVTRYVSHLKR